MKVFGHLRLAQVTRSESPEVKNRSGVKVGVWASSSPTKKAELATGLKRLHELGYETVVPRATQKFATRPQSKTRFFVAGPDELKAQALLELLRHKHVHDIHAIRGGYGSLRLLKHLDRLHLPRSQKRVWGFSDLTSVQHYLYFRLGMPWVHSPMVTSKAFQTPEGIERSRWPQAGQLDQKKSPSTVEHPLTILHLERGTPQRLRAPLLGGNLACLMALFGTRWQPRPSKAFLLFIEELSEPSYRIDRLLTQLSGSDFLKKCRGVVLGHLTECGKKPHELLRLWAQEQKLSLFSGLPAGHDRPNLPIAMGVPVELHVERSVKKPVGARLKLPKVILGC